MKSRAVLSTARGGHIAEPTLTCPQCQKPLAEHKIVILGDKWSWFPVRALVCPEEEEN